MIRVPIHLEVGDLGMGQVTERKRGGDCLQGRATVHSFSVVLNIGLGLGGMSVDKGEGSWWQREWRQQEVIFVFCFGWSRLRSKRNETLMNN